MQRSQLLPDDVQTIRHKTQPIHPAIHLDVDIERRVQLRLLERLDLPVTVHAGGQTVLIKQGQLIGVEKAFQHQYRPFPAQLAQQDRLFKIEHRETVRGAKRVPDSRQAVAISIGFDHRPQARSGRRAANNLLILA